MSIIIPSLVVGNPNDALTWWADRSDTFFQPSNAQQAEWLGNMLESLPDGATLPVRGRDYYTTTTSNSTNTFVLDQEFDHGVAVKTGRRLFFIYESGDVESFLIANLDLINLVHFVSERSRTEQELLQLQQQQCHAVDPKRLVVISHGFSPAVGPDYPIIRTLEAAARLRGWRVLVPDYRESYEWGRGHEERGREARVRILFQELLCLDPPKPDIVVLAGHSQGGACSALAARDTRLVEAVGIKGLFLLGAESALTLDRMTTPPALHNAKNNIAIVHADVDGVISHSQAVDMVRRWKLPSSCLISLKANTPAGSKDCWGDDIAHDFLCKPLVKGAVEAFTSFLSAYETE